MSYYSDRPRILRLRRKLQRADYNRPAVVGDESGIVYAGPGKIWVRFRGGLDANGAVTFAPAVKVYRGSSNYWDKPNAPVRIGYDANDHLVVLGIDNQEAENAGLDSQMLNYGSKSSRWFLLKYATRAACRPVSNSDDSSTLVSVRSLIYDDNYGDLNRLPDTARQADKIDLASYVPAAGYHRIVVVFARTIANTFQVVGSTAQLETSDLDLTDYNECFAQRDAETIPLAAYKLYGGQTAVVIRDMSEDLRQFVNMPQREGFPNPVAKKTILRAGMSHTVSDKLTITGKLTVKGKLTIHKARPCTVPQVIGPVYLPVEILHNSAETTTVTTSSSQWNNCGIYQDSPADNQVVYRVRTYLDPAVYRCRIVYTKSSNTAIIQLRLVGTETVTGSTIDTYAAVIAYNNVDDENLTISKAGEYRVELITNGKNGSSSDYYAWLQSISLSKQ
jgi:hypothetical protein